MAGDSGIRCKHCYAFLGRKDGATREGVVEWTRSHKTYSFCGKSCKMLYMHRCGTGVDSIKEMDKLEGIGEEQRVKNRWQILDLEQDDGDV